MNNALLNSMGKKPVNEFRRDLLEILRLQKEIDRIYSQSNPDFNVYIKKFNSLISLFNKKYKSLNLVLIKKIENVTLKIFLHEKSVKECFANAASKIPGMQSIGASGFGAAPLSNPESFASELEKSKDKLYITYYNPDMGTSVIFLKYDKNEKKVELVYDAKEIENEPSAEFQLAAYYALKECDKKINVHDEAATLGFSSWVTDVKKMKYYEKFDPHASE